MRPSFKELEEKKWYRLWQVLTWVIVVLAFVGPWFIQESSPWLLMDGAVNLVIWLTISFIIREIILYVLYGKKVKNETENIKKKDTAKLIVEWMLWALGFVLIITVMVLLIKIGTE